LLVWPPRWPRPCPRSRQRTTSPPTQPARRAGNTVGSTVPRATRTRASGHSALSRLTCRGAVSERGLDRPGRGKVTMFSIRNVGGVSLLVFGTTFLWLTPMFASADVDTSGATWATAGFLASVTIIGFGWPPGDCSDAPSGGSRSARRVPSPVLSRWSRTGPQRTAPGSRTPCLTWSSTRRAASESSFCCASHDSSTGCTDTS
jgi:hypothetical protein